MKQKSIDTFKQNCINLGIYKNSIFSNDYKNSSNAYFVITIPYGQKNGGQQKTFKQFGAKSIQKAAKFWNDNVSKESIFNF